MHSHTLGLIAVVYACKPQTGGILVCCEHGIITHSGTKADYWVPANKYCVVACTDEVIPIPDELVAVRSWRTPTILFLRNGFLIQNFMI